MNSNDVFDIPQSYCSLKIQRQISTQPYKESNDLFHQGSINRDYHRDLYDIYNKGFSLLSLGIYNLPRTNHIDPFDIEFELPLVLELSIQAGLNLLMCHISKALTVLKYDT
ncbi:hypothetical protein Avbf_09611 [Armadillidium vulgare]|nr:hypothetical protein Avbf_09611 [Armadillidium vulgare]